MTYPSYPYQSLFSTPENEITYPGLPSKMSAKSGPIPVAKGSLQPNQIQGTINPFQALLQEQALQNQEDISQQQRRLAVRAAMNGLGNIVKTFANVYGASKGAMVNPVQDMVTPQINQEIGALDARKYNEQQRTNALKMQQALSEYARVQDTQDWLRRWMFQNEAEQAKEDRQFKNDIRKIDYTKEKDKELKGIDFTTAITKENLDSQNRMKELKAQNDYALERINAQFGKDKQLAELRSELDKNKVKSDKINYFEVTDEQGKRIQVPEGIYWDIVQKLKTAGLKDEKGDDISLMSLALSGDGSKSALNILVAQYWNSYYQNGQDGLSVRQGDSLKLGLSDSDMKPQKKRIDDTLGILK